MKLATKELLKGSLHPKELEHLLSLAEKAYKTFQPTFSFFLSPPVLYEITRIVDQIHDINCITYGGFLGAERKRVAFQRTSARSASVPPLPPITGVQIEGNFLFDRTTTDAFLIELSSEGILSQEIGDIWLIGDRGAQLICTPEAGFALDQKERTLRTVNIKYQILETKQLRPPIQRSPKIINTIEASMRLDAITSAGFGISRSKAVNQIKSGKLRVNWNTVKSASKLIKLGDQIQLERKGTLKIKSVEITKKNRWRIELLRE